MKRIVRSLLSVAVVGTLIVVGQVPSGAANAYRIDEFPLLNRQASPNDMTLGPDGNIWFTEVNGSAVGRITPTGSITEFPTPSQNSRPADITTGPDGNLWFTEGASNVNKVVRMTTSGAMTEFSVPSAGASPDGITTGPDGALWFTEYANGKIGRITTDGQITEFSTNNNESGPHDIVAGPDGALWFTQETGRSIARITVQGQVTTFTPPTASYLDGITVGPDGALWYAAYNSNSIGRLTTTGQFTEFSLPTPANDTGGPDDIITANGLLWFTLGAFDAPQNGLASMTTDGLVTQFVPPTDHAAPDGLAAASDGTIWFAEWSGGQIGHLVVLPDTRIISASVPKGTGRATFRFTAIGSFTGFQCAVLRRGGRSPRAPSFKGCSSPKTYKNIPPGAYTFLVRAVNGSDRDPTPAKKKFTVK